MLWAVLPSAPAFASVRYRYHVESISITQGDSYPAPTRVPQAVKFSRTASYTHFQTRSIGAAARYHASEREASPLSASGFTRSPAQSWLVLGQAPEWRASGARLDRLAESPRP